MSLREDFERQLKAQMEIWQAQIQQYQDQMEKAGEKGKTDYARMIAGLQQKASEAKQMFEQIRSANEAAWEDVQKANQKAFAELQKGWAEALSRFQ